uniref:F-box associated beta-propeller type 3 domain-containing protein n=1 Tax=Triticum aestivum TaxID=4565 RepID=A0A077S0L6_WHEAT|nr:unnamed protein product [Triticum aestivum]
MGPKLLEKLGTNPSNAIAYTQVIHAFKGKPSRGSLVDLDYNGPEEGSSQQNQSSAGDEGTWPISVGSCTWSSWHNGRLLLRPAGTDPTFRALHARARHVVTAAGAEALLVSEIRDPGKSLEVRVYNINSPKPMCRVVGLAGGYQPANACNGFLLLASGVKNSPVLLSNPVAGEKLEVQPPPKINFIDDYWHMYFMGFSPAAHEYKLFRFSFPFGSEEDNNHLDVYTLEDGRGLRRHPILFPYAAALLVSEIRDPGKSLEVRVYNINSPKPMCRVVGLAGGYQPANACNGFLLLASGVKNSPVLLSNPVAGEKLEVQPPPKINFIDDYWHMYFMGFSPAAHEYKLFRFSFPFGSEEDNNHLDVYTLEDGRGLRRHPILFPYAAVNGLHTPPPLFMDGKLYLVVQRHRSPNMILVIDVASEAHCTYRLPLSAYD